MKLTLKIKLLPNEQQALLLKDTLLTVNRACNSISDTVWSLRIFGKRKIQPYVYSQTRQSYQLSAQVVIRAIAKVSDAYRKDKKSKREFRPLGAIAYDSRILSYKNNVASIWTTGGREKIKTVCYKPEYLPYIKGEADLVFKKGKFFLLQTIDVPEKQINYTEDVIGVDLGLTDIAVCCDGTSYNSEQLKSIRKKYTKVRASIQAKGTKSSKKLLKRLAGKESRFVSISNHRITKQLVERAQREGKGIALEDLSNIRKSAKSKSKKQKSELNRWSFYQFRLFAKYKAGLAGVPFILVPPQYTSKTCSICKHIGDRNGKRFSCKNCGNMMDADQNGALNIATWGRVVIRPERSVLFCNLNSRIPGLKLHVNHDIEKAPCLLAGDSLQFACN